MQYCIRNSFEMDDDGIPLYWNNQWGWVNQSEADFFSEEEKNTFNLPMNSYWESSNEI